MILFFLNFSIEELIDIIIVEAHCRILSADSQYRYLNTLQRHNTENSKQNIPRKGIARPQSQFLHSCVCERSYDRSAYSATDT
jgi:hypothetical protein